MAKREPFRVADPPRERPLMLWDGDCGFCRRWIQRWRRLTGKAVDYEPYQAAAGRFPEIPEEAFRHAVRLVLPDGRVLEAAGAVLRALAARPGLAWMEWMYRRLPGFAPAAEAAYAWVAGHRAELSGGPACPVPEAAGPAPDGKPAGPDGFRKS